MRAKAEAAAATTRAVWPARMQRLVRGPLVDAAAAHGCELWLDGGHNPAGGAAVAPDTVRAVEDAILTRARQLRVRDGQL